MNSNYDQSCFIYNANTFRNFVLYIKYVILLSKITPRYLKPTVLSNFMPFIQTIEVSKFLFFIIALSFIIIINVCIHVLLCIMLLYVLRNFITLCTEFNSIQFNSCFYFRHRSILYRLYTLYSQVSYDLLK